MLSADRTFDFNLLRWHGLAPYRGSDVAEMLDVADRITPGDFESWHREFFALAQRVAQEGWADRRISLTTQRDRAFRSASYYRAADFFLHGTPSDPRIMRTWASATEQFDRAISLMNPPGERVAIQADGFVVPAIFFRAGPDNTPRPTVLMFNGFDGSQEEMLHLCGVAALERGFHVLTFEGPGQPAVVREQQIGFRHDWEAVVTPVVDHCETLPEIDSSRLALIGVSFGGYLAPRAAAFDDRIGAVVTIDGLFDANASVANLLTAELKALLEADDVDAFNDAMNHAMDADAGLRWYIQHGLWCFRVPTPYDFFVAARPFTLDGVAQRISCRVLVCSAAEDHLNPGQAERLAAALGDRGTLRTFTAAESAGSHSHPGASMLVNGVVFDWLSDTLDADRAGGVHRGDRELQRSTGGVQMSGRLPALKPDDLNEAQRRLYESLVASYGPWADTAGFDVIAADGSLLGPLNPLLFSPELGAAQIEVFHADKAGSSLSPRVHEVVILTVGKAWNSDYELYAHSAVGRQAGLPDDLVAALLAGALPDFRNEQEAIAHEFTQQLVDEHRVDAETYTRAEQTFGHKGLVDMVLLAGLYLATCSLLNAFEIPARAAGAHDPP